MHSDRAHRSFMTGRPLGSISAALLGPVLAISGALISLALAYPAPAQAAGQTQSAPSAPGVPFAAQKLSSLLPATVYFQGKTAPLQLRNAAGTAFAGGAIVWAALVDTAGYATTVQERYQFYFVTEGPLKIGDTRLAPGAYGGGFVGDRFVLMDVGGHTVAAGATQLDAAMARPRPLQMLPVSSTVVKLALGRRWVQLEWVP